MNKKYLELRLQELQAEEKKWDEINDPYHLAYAIGARTEVELTLKELEQRGIPSEAKFEIGQPVFYWDYDGWRLSQIFKIESIDERWGYYYLLKNGSIEPESNLFRTKEQVLNLVLEDLERLEKNYTHDN